MRILVTGARGFLGRHVTALLAYNAGITVGTLTRETDGDVAAEELARADAVIHLAGVNRPTDDREFVVGNVELTRRIADALAAAGRGAALVISSSSRAQEDTPYGRSKREAEAIVRAYGERTGAPVAVFRLPNVFGKWSRPFYNTVIATFCHSVARSLPFDVHDDGRRLRLVYGEDVAHALIAHACGTADRPASGAVLEVRPEYERSLGEIVALLRQFRALRTELVLPDFSDDFVRKLYTTYVSFIPTEAMVYELRQYADSRGALAEFLKSPWFGQIFVSRTRPGITRGNHFHHTKTEKFMVVEGEAVIRMRPSEGGQVTEFAVRGNDLCVVDIPPGFAHAITNVGRHELVTLFWSSEIFDRDRPDTYPLAV